MAETTTLEHLCIDLTVKPGSREGCCIGEWEATQYASVPVVPPTCPECEQGKHANCTVEVLLDDVWVPCGCSHDD